MLAYGTSAFTSAFLRSQYSDLIWRQGMPDNLARIAPGTICLAGTCDWSDVVFVDVSTDRRTTYGTAGFPSTRADSPGQSHGPAPPSSLHVLVTRSVYFVLADSRGLGRVR